MLNQIRERMAIVIWILVIAFVGTMIFSWGMGGVQSNDPRAKGIIAEINGESAKYSDYSALEDNKTQNARSEDLDDVAIAKLRNDAWTEFVKMNLIGQEYITNEVIVPAKQIVDEILENPLPELKSYPQFMENGKFSLKKYQDFIKSKDPNYAQMYYSIESVTQNRLRGTVLENKLKMGLDISDAELLDEYMNKELKAQVKFLKVRNNDFRPADSTLTDAQIQKYFDDHKDEFGINKASKNYDYVLFSTEITKEDSALALEDINQYMNEIESGMSFEDAAFSFSEDNSAEKSGDLGWFGKGKMVGPFEQAAFAAKKGEIVGPIKTKFGYHLIKVEDKKEKDGAVSDVKARHILVKFKSYPSTTENIRYIASKFREDLNLNGDDSKAFDLAANENGLEIKTAEFVTEGNDYTKDFGQVPGISEFLFTSENGDVSHRLYSSKGYLFIRVKDSKEETPKTLEEARPQVLSKLKNQIASEKSYEKIIELQASIKDTADFNTIAETNDGYFSTQSKDFSRKGYVSGVGKDEEFQKTAFSLKIGEISQPIKGDNSAYLLVVNKRDEFNQEAYDKAKADLKKRMMTMKERDILNTWLDGIVEKADVVDYRNLYR